MQAPARMTSARSRLQPDDRAPLVGVAGPVEVDLAVDLGAVEDRALDDVGVVLRQAVLDRGQVRDGSTHADERIGRRPAVEPREVRGDRGQRLGEHVLGDRLVQAERLGEPRPPRPRR